MDQKKRLNKSVLLCFLVLVALVYGYLLNAQNFMPGTSTRDGIIGVLLGLFICSQPAANFLDALLFGRYLQIQHSAIALELFWWALNVLVLLVGWNVIFIGMVRFTGR